MGAGQHLVGRMVCPSSLHPFWKSWGLIACNSWPWANKRLGCLLALPGASSLETSGTPHPPSHGPWSNLSALSLGLSELPFTQKEGRGSNPDYTDCLGESGLIGPSGEGDGRACLCGPVWVPGHFSSCPRPGFVPPAAARSPRNQNGVSYQTAEPPFP